MDGVRVAVLQSWRRRFDALFNPIDRLPTPGAEDLANAIRRRQRVSAAIRNTLGITASRVTVETAPGTADNVIYVLDAPTLTMEIERIGDGEDTAYVTRLAALALTMPTQLTKES